MRIVRALFVIFFAMVGAQGNVRAEDLKGTAKEVCSGDFCFPRRSEISSLPLAGVAQFRYWGFRVYAAALYAPEDAALNTKNIGQFEKELRLTYYREFDREDFITSGESLMKENPEVTFEDIRAQSEQMNALYQPVKVGDTYSIHFVPGEGTTLRLNGNFIGKVKGDLFGKAYLGVWLSETSIGDSFTEDILNRKRVPEPGI